MRGRAHAKAAAGPPKRADQAHVGAERARAHAGGRTQPRIDAQASIARTRRTSEPGGPRMRSCGDAAATSESVRGRRAVGD